MPKSVSLRRRSFLRAAGAAAAGFTIVPRHVLAQGGTPPPSERPNIAGIGVGGMGAGDLQSVAPHGNIVALCDVDLARGAPSYERFPEAKRYRDFRVMLDEMDKEIDAVVVATPDHTHAFAALEAIRRGKHVYCEKPLAHSVAEVRALMDAAREHQVVTQLGNQGHASDTIRMFCEWIWDGAIGKVHTVHCGCRSVNSAIGALERVKTPMPVPDTLDWDRWLGSAQTRPYHRAYCPGSWRGWTPFGNGTVGDWTCHVVDPVFWALGLGLPTSIQADVADWDPKTQGDAFPPGEVITYEFPQAKHGPVTLKWYSGTRHIPRPPELEDGRNPVETGGVVYGENGTITYGSHGAGGVRLIPETRMQAYTQPDKTIPRTHGHHHDWVDAIRNGRKAGSDFVEYGGPLSEIAMLGVIAIKLPGTRLAYDAAAMRFTNSDEANALVNPAYRAPWSL